MTRGFKEINLEEKEGLKIISLKFNDVLEKEDYELFVPQLENIFQDGGDKVRFLIELEDFKGLTPGAVWEETKFAFRHFSDIDRIAVIGDNRAEKLLTEFTKPFTRAKIKYFALPDIDEAKKWLNEQ